ncbi:MAG: CvpA family protein [Patescibacteria group bacterium]
MTLLDLILVLIIFFFTSTGFWCGLIHALGALVGTIAGVLVAGHYFETFSVKLLGLAMGNSGVAKVVAFILIFLVVSRLVGFVFWIINKMFNVIAKIPVLKSFNHIGGGILGFAEGVVVTGIALVMAGKYITTGWFVDAVAASQVAQWLLKYGQILVPLLPTSVKDIRSIWEQRALYGL